MRKLMFTFLTVLFIFGLTGCSFGTNKNQEENKDENNTNEEEKFDESTVTLEIVDDGTRKEKTIDSLSNENFSAGNFISDYCFDWIFTSAKNRDGKIINDVFDYNGYYDGKDYNECFYDTEEAQALKTQVKETIRGLKVALLTGQYVTYGYPKTMDFLEFCKDMFSAYYGFELLSLTDLGVYFVYQDLMEEYYNSVASMNNVNEWLVKENYASYIDTYLYMTGYHLLVCKMNGSIVYMDSYSDDDKKNVSDLYNLIQTIINKIETEETDKESYTVYNFCVSLDDLFDNGNFADVGDKLRHYFDLANVQGSDFEKYYIDGYRVICETLEITSGVMVEAFEQGVREIYTSQYDELLEKGTIEREVAHDGPIITTFGYHYYVNQYTSISDIWENGKIIDVPNVVHFAFYYDEYRNKDVTDYVSPTARFVSYMKAVNAGDNDTINQELNSLYEYVQYLNLDCLKNITLANINEEFVEKYLRTYTNYDAYLGSIPDTEEIDYAKVTRSNAVTIGLEDIFVPIYSIYSGNYYYMYTILLEFEDEFKAIDLKDKKESIDEMVAYYINVYSGYVSGLNEVADEYENGFFEKANPTLSSELKEHFKTLESNNDGE